MGKALQEKEELSEQEVAVLDRYAVWHPEIKESNACDPCSHCNPDNHPDSQLKSVFLAGSEVCNLCSGYPDEKPEEAILAAKKTYDPCSHCTPCGSCGREG